MIARWNREDGRSPEEVERGLEKVRADFDRAGLIGQGAGRGQDASPRRLTTDALGSSSEIAREIAVVHEIGGRKFITSCVLDTAVIEFRNSVNQSREGAPRSPSLIGNNRVSPFAKRNT